MSNSQTTTTQTAQANADLHRKLDELNRKLDQLLEGGSPAPAATQPIFCGYKCSWDIDDAGWPSYIHLEDGTMASHREKQGHHWYSVSLGDGNYGPHFCKFLRATPPEGLLVMPSQAAPPSKPKQTKPAKPAKPPVKAAAHRRNGQRPPAPKPAPPQPTNDARQGSTSAQMQKIEALGRADYGQNWPTKKQKIVDHFTKSAKRPLSRDEAASIIKGLQTRAEDRNPPAEPATQSPAPPAVAPPAKREIGFVQQAVTTLTRAQALHLQGGSHHAS